MPLYEYYCQPCGETFEQLRPMSRSSEAIACPAGHPGAKRVVSLVAARTWDGGTATFGAPSGGCAGCAGGACATCGS